MIFHERFAPLIAIDFVVKLEIAEISHLYGGACKYYLLCSIDTMAAAAVREA